MADDYKDGTFEVADTARPLTTSADRTRAAPIAATAMQVRRLTPRECERLMGFPDDYTLLPYGPKRKKLTDEEFHYLRRSNPSMTAEEALRQAKDGQRYKALGNSWAVPVVRWIGERINAAALAKENSND